MHALSYLDTTSLSSEGSLLAGMLLLYVGMSIILCNHNLSTELGITNGALHRISYMLPLVL